MPAARGRDSSDDRQERPHQRQPACRGEYPSAEDERDIRLDPPLEAGEPDPRPARTLIATKKDLRGAVPSTASLERFGATGNVELEHLEGKSLIGLGETLLEPLARNTDTDTAHAGFVLNGNVSSWHWSGLATATCRTT